MKRFIVLFCLLISTATFSQFYHIGHTVDEITSEYHSIDNCQVVTTFSDDLRPELIVTDLENGNRFLFLFSERSLCNSVAIVPGSIKLLQDYVRMYNHDLVIVDNLNWLYYEEHETEA